MKIAIIGAGGAGLCAARHCRQENFSIDVFEQTGNVGGTWNYTDLTGFDEHGIPVHSSMYKGLRTNLPKEVMAYEDFPYPAQKQSFLPQEQVIDYIVGYSKEFRLDPYVRFHKRVLLVEPRNDQWLVEFEDVKSKEKDFEYYGAVMVCNGHYSNVFIPEILGVERFTGNLKHSHNYRTPDCFKNRRVLVLGAGPSGSDISRQIAPVAKQVYLSHRTAVFLPVDEAITSKPEVTRFDGNRAIFDDGTNAEIDDVLYCTGYKTTFAFLSDSCGVQVVDNYVHPLYKQIVSIENPTLGFIGVPFAVCPFPLFDIQVRFFLTTLTGHFKLPPKEEMLEDLKKCITAKENIPIRKYHQLGENQERYFDELAETAKIKKIRPVINKLYMEVRMRRNLDHCYRIIDDENWEQIL